VAAAFVASSLVFGAIEARAQAVIKVNDEVNFRFGGLLQTQADWQEDAATGDYATNLFLRRVRVLFGGNFTKQISFFLETDNPNLGKAVGNTKSISSGLILQDAFVDYKPHKDVDLFAGLIIIPFCRNCMQSATNLFALEYWPYNCLQSAATTSVNGRDTGFMARGYLFDQRLELRLGAFQGLRQDNASSALRVAGRAQYSFGDPDVVQMFYAGTTFGAKNTIVAGAGFDHQEGYTAWAADFTVDRRLGPGAVNFQTDVVHYDGGSFLKTLPEQTDLLVEGGYHFLGAKVSPFVQVSAQRFADEPFTANDQTRTVAGLAYYLKGHNANVKAGYLWVARREKDGLNGFTVQFQAFFY
jgi:hypothetical protein